MSQITKTDTAEAELLEDGARTATLLAAGVRTNFELRSLLRLLDQRFFCHLNSALPFALERETEGVKQSATFSVSASSRHDGDVEPASGIDLVVFDFGEDQLLDDAEGLYARSHSEI